jgi:hypothetical protein
MQEAVDTACAKRSRGLPGILSKLDLLREVTPISGTRPRDLWTFRLLASARQDVASFSTPFLTVAAACLALGWIIPSPLEGRVYTRPPALVSSAQADDGPPREAVTFAVSIHPVQVLDMAGVLCRTHRSLRVPVGMTTLPRCHALGREAATVGLAR